MFAMSVLGASGSDLATVVLQGVPRWAMLTRKSLSRRRADAGSLASSLVCCCVFFARIFPCNSGALVSLFNISCFAFLSTVLKALISASIIFFGVRNPDGNAVVWDKSRSAIEFHTFCSSSVKT